MIDDLCNAAVNKLFRGSFWLDLIDWIEINAMFDVICESTVLY